MDQDQMNDYGKGAVESLLFISDKPVTVDQIKEAIETLDPGEIRRVIAALQQDYESRERGMTIVEIAGGFQMLSNPQYAEYVRNFFKTRVKEKLSRPGLEALAIAAYRQPVSRADIELIRGVNSDGVVTNLLEKGLIKIVGRKDVPGRPFLYGTTKLFLEYFGLKSLKDLPKLEDVSEFLAADASAQGSDSELFGSNKSVDMEKATAEFGGDEHVHRKVEVAESFSEEIEEGDEVFEASTLSDQEGAPAGNDRQDAAAEGDEEIGDLKRVMDEMSREHSDQTDEALDEAEASAPVFPDQDPV